VKAIEVMRKSEKNRGPEDAETLVRRMAITSVAIRLGISVRAGSYALTGGMANNGFARMMSGAMIAGAPLV
jgi:hypothetical protein